MDNLMKESLWKQFGASIDMLENSITACPEHLWSDKKLFWYWTYHTIFYLDYYLTLEPQNFSPPKPFTLSEFENGTMPERIYTKEELIMYLRFCKNKCHDLIKNLTNENINNRWINEYRNYSIFELLLYNMRHVQHHMAQLNLMLRQEINDAPRWVSQTKQEL